VEVASVLTRRQWLRRGAHGVAALGLLAAGCGTRVTSPEPGAPQATGTAGPGGAKAPTGRLSVYAALTAANGQALQDAFQQANPGAQVTILTSGSGALLSRVEAERRAGGVNADVLLLADPTAIAGLDGEGILSHTLPDAASSLPESLRGPAWFAPFTFHNVILAHKGMSAPEPRDWPDLAGAAYQGRLEIGNPGYSGTTLAMVGVLSARLGWSYFTELKQRGAAVVQSTNTVGTDVASGAKWVGASLDSVARPLMGQGSPVDMVWPAGGTITVPAPAALVKGKESDLTAAFLAWLLSDAAQAVFARSGLSAVAGPAAAGQSHPELAVDWPSLARDRDAIIQRFNQIFGL
jgi:iron(III) transport system substrate-binding protein